MFFKFNKFISFLCFLICLILLGGFESRNDVTPKKRRHGKAKHETGCLKLTKYDLQIIDILPSEVLMEIATVENLNKDIADALTLEALMNLEVDDSFGKDIIAANP